jgi:hypothetical protein
MARGCATKCQQTRLTKREWMCQCLPGKPLMTLILQKDFVECCCGILLLLQWLASEIGLGKFLQCFMLFYTFSCPNLGTKSCQDVVFSKSRRPWSLSLSCAEDRGFHRNMCSQDSEVPLVGCTTDRLRRAMRLKSSAWIKAVTVCAFHPEGLYTLYTKYGLYMVI